MIMFFYWQKLFISSSTELESNHSIQNFPTISPTFDSAEFTADVFREEESFTSSPGN
jgi:hypothetical protein